MPGHAELADPTALLRLAGWLLAVLVLFVGGLLLPLQTRAGGWRAWLYAGGVAAAGIAVAVLANVALVLHDSHFDLTREKVYTPSAAALQAIAELDRPVSVTYFYHGQDPVGRRTADLLKVLDNANPWLTVETVDPDKEPTLARSQGIRVYNAAVVEAEGRRILVQSTDEAEIAIGIQRVLRRRTVTACFLEGHGELPMDNFEFHTHLEGLTDHSHGEASSHVVETPGHGIGRLRRSLEAQGYETRKVILATLVDVPTDCTLLIAASPRTTFLPGESAALRRYLRAGGAALLLFDLGFVLEPELARLVADLGVRPAQSVIVDPLSHYMTDPEMVAVAGYDPHPITRSVSLTFFPGARPLLVGPPAEGISVVPLLASSRDSYTRLVRAVAAREVVQAAAAEPQPAVAGPRVFGVAVEGMLPGGSGPLRAVIVGDGDFASNSFYPYMANADLLLASVRWLAREERGTQVAARIPVPPLILLTANQWRAVFAVLVILLPLSVVAVGGVVWWRRR